MSELIEDADEIASLLNEGDMEEAHRQLESSEHWLFPDDGKRDELLDRIKTRAERSVFEAFLRERNSPERNKR